MVCGLGNILWQILRDVFHKIFPGQSVISQSEVSWNFQNGILLIRPRPICLYWNATVPSMVRGFFCGRLPQEGQSSSVLKTHWYDRWAWLKKFKKIKTFNQTFLNLAHRDQLARSARLRLYLWVCDDCIDRHNGKQAEMTQCTGLEACVSLPRLQQLMEWHYPVLPYFTYVQCLSLPTV